MLTSASTWSWRARTEWLLGDGDLGDGDESDGSEGEEVERGHEHETAHASSISTLVDVTVVVEALAVSLGGPAPVVVPVVVPVVLPAVLPAGLPVAPVVAPVAVPGPVPLPLPLVLLLLLMPPPLAVRRTACPASAPKARAELDVDLLSKCWRRPTKAVVRTSDSVILSNDAACCLFNKLHALINLAGDKRRPLGVCSCPRQMMLRWGFVCSISEAESRVSDN